MKKVLWIGDAGVPSGFAKATHKILEEVSKVFAVTVLGINYRGDPHAYPYPIYSAFAGGDAIGVGRLIWMCDLVKPDVIVIQNDGWHMQHYVQQLRRKKTNGEYAWVEYASIPVVAAVAVDGKNFQGQWLQGITSAIFWTQFALQEARDGGYTGPAKVIPLGVDTDVYRPGNQLEARQSFMPKEIHEAFIVGNVNRNQPRKRWDLTLKYFAEWVKRYNVRDAMLFLHTAPTGDMGTDIEQLARYYGILPNVAVVKPPTYYGISEVEMRNTYNSFDVQISTSQGEGFGLTTFEGMACGIPQIVPEWSALAELCKGAAEMIPCTSTALNTVSSGLNVIGGVPDEAQFIAALQRLYTNRGSRADIGTLGLERATESRFNWTNIGMAYVDVLENLVGTSQIRAVS